MCQALNDKVDSCPGGLGQNSTKGSIYKSHVIGVIDGCTSLIHQDT